MTSLHTLSVAVLVTALRNYAGHVADCATQQDDGCTCGWVHVLDLIGSEPDSEADLRHAAHAAATALGFPFWEVEVLVRGR